MNLETYESSFDTSKKNYQVFSVLKDQQWHCRECEYTHIGITQIAGGSGIQGLQRGTKTRPGIEIASGNHLCAECGRKTRHDKWSGQYKEPTPGPSMTVAFARRVVSVLGSRDVIEGTERPFHQLTPDHKLPLLRWNAATTAKLTNHSSMTDDDIREHFQLLKKSNGSVSHNLLKSRACERCYQTGNRGQPFGISFFYSGGKKWEPEDARDAQGCVGCGWYDFDEWRQCLNETLRCQP